MLSSHNYTQAVLKGNDRPHSCRSFAGILGACQPATLAILVGLNVLEAGAEAALAVYG